MSRKKLASESRTINWNPYASTVKHGSREPYDLGSKYKPNAVDQNKRKRGYNSHAVVDEQVQR